MVGAGAESLEALPLPVQRRVAALQALQRQSDEARQRLRQGEFNMKVWITNMCVVIGKVGYLRIT